MPLDVSPKGLSSFLLTVLVYYVPCSKLAVRATEGSLETLVHLDKTLQHLILRGVSEVT